MLGGNVSYRLSSSRLSDGLVRGNTVVDTQWTNVLSRLVATTTGVGSRLGILRRTSVALVAGVAGTIQASIAALGNIVVQGCHHGVCLDYGWIRKLYAFMYVWLWLYRMVVIVFTKNAYMCTSFGG